MNIDELFQDPEYGNFVCVYLGLAFIGQILEPYTRNGLQQVHRKIHAALEGNPQCTGTCGNGSSRCETCKKWQEKLKTFRRKQNFDWTKQKSWQWTLSYENIAGIYTSSPEGPFNFGDLSITCSIWESCTEFNIEPSVLKKVNKFRNDYFEGNVTLKVTDDNKAEAFGALTDLLNEGDIQNHINPGYLNRLEEIKNGKNLPPEIVRSSVEIKKIRNEQDKVVKIVTEPNEAGTEDRKVKQQERQQLEHVYLRARLDVILNILRSIHSYSKYECVTGGILVAIVVVYFLHSYLPGDQTLELYFTPSRSYMNSFDSKYSGCLSEFYESHTSSQSLDFRHLWDLPTQNKLIGREWIFSLFEEKMFQPQNKSRGILMIAEYGFGKSAIVAHLLCAQENEKGWKLRQHVVAFHVCKFRNEISKKPVQLIKRLRWFLSVKSDAYRRHIASLKNSIMDDDEKCEKNIDKCFDDAILNPLDKLAIPHDAPWIVVIDALDECNETDGPNRILELLHDRLIHMQQDGPKWFKWIITSRYMISLKHLDKLELVNFPFEHKRNSEDIRQFIIAQVSISDVRLLDTLVRKCKGNILYAKHALEYMVESRNVSIENIDSLPSGMDDIYELNFDRLFGNNNDFGVAKHILQLVSVKEFQTADLLRILEAHKATNKSEFERIMEKLSFFVASDQFLALRHHSLYDWLRSDNNFNYRISPRLGHVTVSEFLFNITDVNDLKPTLSSYVWFCMSETFFELAYHVSESEEMYLQRKFFAIKLSPGKIHLYHNILRPSCYNIRSNKMLKLIVNFVMGEIAQYDTRIRFIRALYHSIVPDRHNKLDIVSLIRDNVGNVYEIDEYPLHTAAKYCNEELAQYLIKIVNISLWERGRDVFTRAIDDARDFGCISVAKLIAEKDPSVLDAQFVMSAKLHEPGKSIGITKFLVAKRKKLNCVDIILQKEIMMHVYSMRRMLISLSSFSYIEDSRNAFIDRIFGIFVEYKKRRSVFNVIADLYPELLTCPDIFGYTPTLRFIILNDYVGFSTILHLGINDKCQHVPSGMLYMYNVFTLFFVFINHFPETLVRYPKFYKAVACPEQASVEHLLMRHKRIDMINLVIANGYIMNWTKTDRKENTPFDYADQMFILQLECHFGVAIGVLSDKERLVLLCSCEWFYFYFLLVMCALAYYIVFLYCIISYYIETIIMYILRACFKHFLKIIYKKLPLVG